MEVFTTPFQDLHYVLETIKISLNIFGLINDCLKHVMLFLRMPRSELDANGICT